MAVHKISASEKKTAPKTDKTKAIRAPKVKKERKLPRGLGWLGAIGRYFKGAWHELREVRWPNRRTTWGMTAAILIYTALIAAVILLLDAGFKALFELILK